MVYIFKEYDHFFDTPAKMQQETAVVNKIMDLLNKNKYDSIEEFIDKNQTYQDFLKKNELENVMKHFGNTLNEEDYKNILNEMIKLTEKKRNFEKENIKTTNIDDKTYNSFEGKDKTTHIDNSSSNISIEQEMKDLQTTEEKFQTSNMEENTEAMFNTLAEEKKETLNLRFLNEINMESLNDEELGLYNAAIDFQLSETDPIRVDLERGLIVNSKEEILKIEKKDEEFNVLDENNEIVNNEKETNLEKTYQKTLTPSPNTIYSDNYGG